MECLDSSGCGFDLETRAIEVAGQDHSSAKSLSWHPECSYKGVPAREKITLPRLEFPPFSLCQRSELGLREGVRYLFGRMEDGRGAIEKADKLVHVLTLGGWLRSLPLNTCEGFFGTRIDPSACWLFSKIATISRDVARPDPLSVWTKWGFSFFFR